MVFGKCDNSLDTHLPWEA